LLEERGDGGGGGVLTRIAFPLALDLTLALYYRKEKEGRMIMMRVIKMI